MSYILDALKKLENEQSQKVRGNGMPRISGVLFENMRPASARTLSWKIALAVIVAVVVTFIVTWHYLQPDKNQSATVPQLNTPVFQLPPAKIESTPLPPVPSIVPGQNSPPLAPTAVRPATPPPVKSKLVTSIEDPASLLTLQELHNRKIDRKGQAQPVGAAPADIKLSGIAYQDERRARRAVVNGFLIKEGGVVAGAVVTDIFQDRVRFSLAGTSFELSLVSSGVPATGR